MSADEYQELALRTVRESDWQQQVIETLQWGGFPRELIYHTRDSRGSQAGFLDLFAIRLRDEVWTLLIVELKRETEELSPEQRKWFDCLEVIARLINDTSPWVRVIVDVWRPRDADRIRELLGIEQPNRG